MRIGSQTSRSRRVRRSGQILVIALLSMTLLVAVIFYVYNLGDQVNKRQALQDAADSTVISGSAWMARSLNVMAMTNCGQARVLANIPIQDAFPLATKMSLEEVIEWEKALGAQLGRGVSNVHGERAMLQQGLASLRQRMADQRDILFAFNQAMPPMEQYTTWAIRGGGGNTPHGGLWQAACELEKLNRAEVESAGELAQANAVRFGRPNGVDGGLMVPLVPRVPAIRGRFGDFEGVLRGKEFVDGTHVESQSRGGAGGAIPDATFPHRLGPWARLFRWRNEVSEATDWAYSPPSGPVVGVRGGGGAVQGGRRVGTSAMTSASGGGGGWHATAWRVLGYTTYGPYAWAFQRLWDYCKDYYDGRRVIREGHLPDTFFYEYHHQIADTKLEYMFGSKNPREIHYPVWITPYPQCRQLAERGDVRVARTMFYLVEIASSAPPTGGKWLSPGTFRSNGDRPVAIWFNGWTDPERWRIRRVGDYIWNDEYTYECTQDPEIGIYEQLDPQTGQPIWQTVYMSAWYIFGGIDVGGEIEISDPSNYDNYDSLPRPYVMDTTGGDYDPNLVDPDQGFRRDNFSFLGVVRRGNTAPVWPQQFSHPHPLNDMLAVSQSIVFNPSSFDLWTQNWQTQLAPSTRWGDWASRLNEDASQDLAKVRALVSQQEFDIVAKFLDSLPADLVRRYRQN